MKSFIKAAGVICLVLALSGCDQWFARQWGGTVEITLDKGKRLVNVSWKDDGNLWLLTKEGGSVPTTYTFQENSIYGILQGKVVIKEQ